MATAVENVTGIDLANAPVLPEKTNAPVLYLTTDSDVPDAIRAAMVADSPELTTTTLKYASSKKNAPALMVTFAIGAQDTWTPTRDHESTHRIGSAAAKSNEYDAALLDGLQVRGGTVLAFAFGYKTDGLGFQAPNYRPTVAALEKAFFRTPEKLHGSNARSRIDTEYRLLANDQNAPNVKDVAGYILVRIKGYRVK